MRTAQYGIFTLGNPSHSFLEFDLLKGKTAGDLVAAVKTYGEPRTTGGGVNLVVGFRPELWRQFSPGDAPVEISGFNRDLVGLDGYTMPATQHDLVLWFTSSTYDYIFDLTRDAVAAFAAVARIVDETTSWPYHGKRDLTGFVDGTENPKLTEAPEIVMIPPGRPGEGGSVLLLQKWPHDREKWEALAVSKQELVIGRTKSESIELDPKPADAHAAKTDQDVFGKVLRRNMPFGNFTNHGTMFVGFSADQVRLQKMLESMAGLIGGQRDALTYYTHPVTGAYYFVPAIESLAPPDDED
ncbi:MAG TPA: Dyp-type peroxidase [Terriglobales bacterium]|nr:Dyp-type peroxidase [Terriglobales bacterium]